MQTPKVVLITGASSGIGAALATCYAAPGVTLYLSGRDSERLDAVVADCAALGAAVAGQSVDVTDRTAMHDWITALDAQTPLDLVIANAGISAGTGDGGETPEQARQIFAVNLDGVLNTLLPAARGMAARRRGQLAVMSSLASFRGFPGAPAYCASKAAVRVWGEALRGSLAAQGVGVSVICPGFVRSRMTAVNNFPMPLLMDADKAAALIRRGLVRNRARIAFPLRLYLAVRMLAGLPTAVTEPLLRRLPEKR